MARCLDDNRYAIAQSTLSEYEVRNTPPRHIEKALALCIIYGIRLLDIATASGTAPEELGQKRIPRENLPIPQKATGPRTGQSLRDCSSGPVSSSLPRRFGEVPWFLCGSLPELVGMTRVSIRDFFWLTGTQRYLPRDTQGDMLALVNRRKQRPVRLPQHPRWHQPAYVLLLRSGEYRCACCSLDRDTLVLHPESDGTQSPEQLRVGRDVEVIGQIVAVARRITEDR